MNKSTHPLKPLLRWAGSKHRLIPDLAGLMPIGFETYIEPFAGSAALFFASRPKKAVLSDINAELINFYRKIRAHPTDFHSALTVLDGCAQSYDEIRTLFNTSSDPDIRAATFWYLNRQCFNGLYRTSRSGEFNVPRGSKLPPMPSSEQTRDCAAQLSRARLVHSDYEAVIDSAERGDFVYVDPPYRRHSTRDRGEYGEGAMKDSDMDRLLGAVRRAERRGVKLLVSYNVNLASELPGWKVRSVNSRYLISADTKMRRPMVEFIANNY